MIIARIFFELAIRGYDPPGQACQEIMKNNINDKGLSTRADDKIFRVACTIADLNASNEIQTHHKIEAVNNCILDRICKCVISW